MVTAQAAVAEAIEADGLAAAALKVAISCGEALPAATQRLFFRAFPDSAKLSNVYGPTEADMTFYEIDFKRSKTMKGPPPIGRPMDNVTAYRRPRGNRRS